MEYEVTSIDPEDCPDAPPLTDRTTYSVPLCFSAPYCFTTIANEEINGLALHNKTKYAASDHVFSFTSETTEFRTDNCATRHTCSLLKIFVSLRPAPKIGITGVAGIKMEFSIGTILFTITDDNGKHKITLEDVIYLPESVNNLISTSK